MLSTAGLGPTNKVMQIHGINDHGGVALKIDLNSLKPMAIARNTAVIGCSASRASHSRRGRIETDQERWVTRSRVAACEPDGLLERAVAMARKC